MQGKEGVLSAYSIAREHLDTVSSLAADSGVDLEAALRAVIGEAVERYRDLKGVDDLRAVLQYQLDNASGHEDYEFMRP